MGRDGREREKSVRQREKGAWDMGEIRQGAGRRYEAKENGAEKGAHGLISQVFPPVPEEKSVQEKGRMGQKEGGR